MTQVYTEEEKAVVPHGVYCYDQNGICPYWHKFVGEDINGAFETGYCSLIDMADCITLWDQLKECGINDENKERER